MPTPESQPRRSISDKRGRPQRLWRFELKYLIERHVRRPLTADLRAFVDPDLHAGPDGFYTVRSLYLDSPDWMCFHDKMAGLPVRYKLRIRGYPNDEHVPAVKFEVKYRAGNRISKDVAVVAAADYEPLLSALHARRMAEVGRLHESPPLQAFFRLKQIYAMAPVVNVQFRRQAFCARSDRHVRITLDDTLLAHRARNLFDPMSPARPLLDRMACILEIKVRRDLPFWLQRLIAKYHLRLESISKYSHSVANGPFGLAGIG